MKKRTAFMQAAVVLGLWQVAFAQVSERVVDVPSRPGVTQRFLFLTPEKPKAALILLAGGNGRLAISQDGSIRFLSGNFLVRARRLFTDKGFSVAIVDAPSDRQQMTLKGFRQTPQHVADIKAVIAWLKQQSSLPVWLVGTSHGTQSAAFVATELSGSQGGPDGLVLTSTILLDDRERAVPQMPLQRLAIPVLVVHHEQDGCRLCPFSAISGLMKELDGAPRKSLISVRGGDNRGDPCEAFAYHGFNGLEKDVVGKIADWIYSK
jgi:dienelactone hydrolase